MLLPPRPPPRTATKKWKTLSPPTLVRSLVVFAFGRLDLRFQLWIYLAAPRHVIDLPDDDEEVPLRARKNRQAVAGKATRTASAPEVLVQEGGDITRHSVTFAVPLTSARPSSSTADPPSLFATHHVPEDQAGAAKEAIRQAGIMMEQVKAIREASQAAYDASSALQSNVQVSWSPLVLLGYAI